MSEENAEKDPPKLRKIEIDDLERYFIAHEISDTCSCCGNNSWGIVDPLEEHIFSLRSMKFSEAGLSFATRASNVPTVVMLCEKCGSIRMFAAFKILLWLAG